ncbi:unnamed protein product [Ceutorhynchus assimilis]|uniref:Uncharacterized protein n=1 Tax=Ceutorhynchus assimilis TaxID=467358 RepID=A0A9N9QT14_9CUCU|nr:unnamed protein product [Ceutorhynchus assimilis]
MDFESSQIIVRSNLSSSRDIALRKIITAMSTESVIQSVANHFYCNHKVKTVLLGDANCNGLYYNCAKDEITLTITPEFEELVRYINSIGIEEFDLFINNSFIQSEEETAETSNQKSKTLSLYVNLQVTASYERLLLKIRPSAFTPISKLFENVIVELGDTFDGSCKRTPTRLL